MKKTDKRSKIKAHHQPWRTTENSSFSVDETEANPAVAVRTPIPSAFAPLGGRGGIRKCAPKPRSVQARARDE